MKNEDFGDTHMLPLFIRLNKDSLQHTAYIRINSKEDNAKILAAKILSFTPLNLRTEELLKIAAKGWDFKIKGFAIYTIAELQIGNLLETLKPMLDSPQTRGIALKALSNSPTEADRQYLFYLVNQSKSISKELLDCFFNSKNIGNVKYGLGLLITKQIPEKYYFSITDQPFFRSDTLLPDIYLAIQKVKNVDILSELVRALSGRTDSQSTAVLLKLLTHENSTIRYWTAESLKGNHSRQLFEMIPKLLNKSSTRVTSLTALAIENNLDSLQDIYDKSQPSLLYLP